MIQGELRLSVGPVHGELGHEQVRAIVTGKGLEITCHELLCPIELAFAHQRTIARDPAEPQARARPRAHQLPEDGQSRQEDSDRRARS